VVALARDDGAWMRRALFLAARGLGRTTPNPVVGACIVSDEGVVVGQGSHERAGEPHAEVHALNAAGARANGATLYCTLEPCSHTGRTGPCTDRILDAGIRRVVAAIEDPDPRVKGRGFARLRQHGVDVVVGVEHRAAARLNGPFLTVKTRQRPFVILKAATSANGFIAADASARTFLTSTAANRRAQSVRARVDAIAVGAGTLLADDPLLTSREVYRERALTRVIFDRRLRVPANARVFSTLPAGPVIILTSRDSLASRVDAARALEKAGATIVPVEGSGIATMVAALVPFDVQSVLLEGGAEVHAAAWDAGIVDCVHIYVTPHTIAKSGLPLLDGKAFSVPSLHDLKVEVHGPDVIIEGYVHGVD
jgi:diaminohydroxyphosphoribosylaminopyrimidine deaminase / 5-amino-6-(5-phosphoribosylamino)uracil reductase